MNKKPTLPTQEKKLENLLSTFIQLEKEAWKSVSETAFGFIVCNSTKSLISYEKAILWKQDTQSVLHISGSPSIQSDSPSICFINTLLSTLKPEQEEPYLVEATSIEIPVKLSDEAARWIRYPWLICPMKDETGSVIGSMVFIREKTWGTQETTIIAHLMQSYALGWASLEGRKRFYKKRKRSFSKKKKYYIALLIMLATLLLCLPIRHSVVVAGEIAPTHPIAITSPMEGVIKTLFVQPNQKVTKNTQLFTLDPTDTYASYRLSEKNWMVAKEKYRRVAQQYFYHDSNKLQLQTLKAEAEKSASEYAHMRSRVQKLISYAPKSGVIIYDNPVDLTGKPVVTGEKIMELANPKEKSLLLWVPVADAINLGQDSVVKFFLNTQPLSPLQARITYAAYNAIKRPNGEFAYRVKAAFLKPVTDYRFGLQGQAKIYGQRVSLFYYLFWRPLSTARRWAGM